VAAIIVAMWLHRSPKLCRHMHAIDTTKIVVAI